MILLVFLGIIIGLACGMLIGAAIGKADANDGTLYIYPDEQNKMCTVASFTQETIQRLLQKDPSFKYIHMDVKHLDAPTRNNISSNNEESSTTVL